MIATLQQPEPSIKMLHLSYTGTQTDPCKDIITPHSKPKGQPSDIRDLTGSGVEHKPDGSTDMSQQVFQVLPLLQPCLPLFLCKSNLHWPCCTQSRTMTHSMLRPSRARRDVLPSQTCPYRINLPVTACLASPAAFQLILPNLTLLHSALADAIRHELDFLNAKYHTEAAQPFVTEACEAATLSSPHNGMYHASAPTR